VVLSRGSDISRVIEALSFHSLLRGPCAPKREIAAKDDLACRHELRQRPMETFDAGLAPNAFLRFHKPVVRANIRTHPS
jgi:hypothetical protein